VKGEVLGGNRSSSEEAGVIVGEDSHLLMGQLTCRLHEKELGKSSKTGIKCHKVCLNLVKCDQLS
jgi:hypothetical protein